MGLNAAGVNLSQFFGLAPGETTAGDIKPKVLPKGAFEATLVVSASGMEELTLDVDTPVYDSRLIIREQQTSAKGYKWSFEFVGSDKACAMIPIQADSDKIVLQMEGDPDRQLIFSKESDGDILIEAVGMPAPDLTLQKKPQE